MSLLVRIVCLISDLLVTLLFYYSPEKNQEYRQRVCSALAKFHGSEAGAERKPRRRPSDGTQRPRRSPIRRKATDAASILVNSDDRILYKKQLKRRKSPVYKDPLVSSKLEMIKNIRAQRASEENKQAEKAIERAR